MLALLFYAAFGTVMVILIRHIKIRRSVARSSHPGATVAFRNYLHQHHAIEDELWEQMQAMNLRQLEELATAQHWMQMEEMQTMEQQLQEMVERQDPYLHPGIDIVVDESYHGINHGSLDHDQGFTDY